MPNPYTYVGIDVSKDKLDLAIPTTEGKYPSFQLANTEEGFAALREGLPQDGCSVMEATRAYHCRLAFFLAEQGQAVWVVNALSVKHFARLQLLKTKTDKADAVLLASDGQVLQPPLGQPPAQHLIELKQVYGVLEQFTQPQTALLNQKQALQLMPHPSSKALAVIDEQLASMADLEKHLDPLLRQHYQDLNDGLQSIPGLGPTTALLLIVVSQGFVAFEHANQLIAYVGLAPRIDQSGKTVLKNHINKQGAARLRKVL